MSKTHENIWEKETTALKRKLKRNQARRWSFRARTERKDERRTRNDKRNKEEVEEERRDAERRIVTDQCAGVFKDVSVRRTAGEGTGKRRSRRQTKSLSR